MNKKISRVISLVLAVIMLVFAFGSLQAKKSSNKSTKWTPKMLKSRLETMQKSTYANFNKVLNNNKKHDNQDIMIILEMANEVASLDRWSAQCDNLIFAAKQLGSAKTKTIANKNVYGQNAVIRRKNDVITWAETGNRNDGSLSYGESRFIEYGGAANEYFEYQDGARAYGSIYPTATKGLYVSAVEMDEYGDYIVCRAYMGTDVYRFAMMFYPKENLTEAEKNDPFPFLAQKEPKDWESFLEESMIEMTYNKNKITITYLGEEIVLK